MRLGLKAETKVGDIVDYVTFGGDTRRVRVTLSDDDIKNGRPGFDGIAADGMPVWGYDSQIVRIVRDGTLISKRY